MKTKEQIKELYNVYRLLVNEVDDELTSLAEELKELLKEESEEINREIAVSLLKGFDNEQINDIGRRLENFYKNEEEIAVEEQEEPKAYLTLTPNDKRFIKNYCYDFHFIKYLNRLEKLENQENLYYGEKEKGRLLESRELQSELKKCLLNFKQEMKSVYEVLLFVEHKSSGELEKKSKEFRDYLENEFSFLN